MGHGFSSVVGSANVFSDLNSVLRPRALPLPAPGFLLAPAFGPAFFLP